VTPPARKPEGGGDGGSAKIKLKNLQNEDQLIDSDADNSSGGAADASASGTTDGSGSGTGNKSVVPFDDDAGSTEPDGAADKPLFAPAEKWMSYDESGPRPAIFCLPARDYLMMFSIVMIPGLLYGLSQWIAGVMSPYWLGWTFGACHTVPFFTLMCVFQAVNLDWFTSEKPDASFFTLVLVAVAAFVGFTVYFQIGVIDADDRAVTSTRWNGTSMGGNTTTVHTPNPFRASSETQIYSTAVLWFSAVLYIIVVLLSVGAYRLADDGWKIILSGPVDKRKGGAGLALVASAMLLLLAFFVIITIVVRPWVVGASLLFLYVLTLGCVAVFIKWVNNNGYLPAAYKGFIVLPVMLVLGAALTIGFNGYWFLGFSAALFTAAFFIGCNVVATHWDAGGGSTVSSGALCYTSTVFPILRYTPAQLGGGGGSSIKSSTSVAVQAYGVMCSMVLWGLVGTVFIKPCTCNCWAVRYTVQHDCLISFCFCRKTYRSHPSLFSPLFALIPLCFLPCRLLLPL
jgi:hypothetical protein